MQKLVTALSLLLLFRAADVFAVEPIDPPVGKMYWINDRADGVAPVEFFTIPHGKLVTFGSGHTFVVVRIDATNPQDIRYEVKTDDGQELYLPRDHFQRALFSESEYVAFADGPRYTSLRQYIFAAPPSEITGAIDRKQAAARRAASAAKQAKDAAFRARLANAETSYQSRLAARIALGGVRLGMTREQPDRAPG
jgi:hypothetical protein